MTPRHIIITLTLILVAFIIPAVALAQTYVPAGTPFGGPSTPPLNSSTNTQRKLGPLGIGSIASPQSLCLNATNPGDPTCITAWSNLSGQIGGPFVSLSQNAWALNLASTNCSGTSKSLCPADYISQTGFVQAKALSSPQQALTTIVEDANLQLCNSNRTLSTPSPGKCAVGIPKQGQNCYLNSDCGYTATAVYGNDADNAAETAGYFSGVAFVTAPTGDNFLTAYGRVCLNGNENFFNSGLPGGLPGGNCISSWLELSGGSSLASALYVKRQLTNPPAGQQVQGAAISGVGQFGSGLAGNACLNNPTLTCGDGMCANTTLCPSATTPETASNCPIDCAAVGTPTFSVTPGNTLNVINISGSNQSPAGPVWLLIVRRDGGSPVFRPQAGFFYDSGMVFSGGNDRIIYSQSVTPGVNQNFNDPGLINGHTYYYNAYQANLYPRYVDPGVGQIATPANITFVTLNVFENLSGVSPVTGPGINCWRSPPAGPDCTETFVQYTDVTLEISDVSDPNYTFAGWIGACNNSELTCTFTMNANRSVSANFVQN